LVTYDTAANFVEKVMFCRDVSFCSGQSING